MTDSSPKAYVQQHSAWGRWGPDDAAAGVNLVTPERVVAAARLVRTGVRLSLTRPVVPGAAHGPGTARMEPARVDIGGGVVVQRDIWSLDYHGGQITHLDALSHIEIDGRLWNDRETALNAADPAGSWGDITTWTSGIVTRGVLFDVPRYRGTPYVTQDAAVTGDELAAIAAAHRLDFQPGDAMVIFSGRQAWDAANDEYGSVSADGSRVAPGLDGSCLSYLRTADPSVLVVDMMDRHDPANTPPGLAVHLALNAFGVALLDNARLEDLAAECRQQQRTDFMLLVAPLSVQGATGSPVNPIAVL